MDLSRLQLKPHKLFHHLEELLKWRKGEYFAPIFIELSPTDVCNQKCFFCYTAYMGHQKLTIPGELLIRIFTGLGQAGVKSVMIQGTGEPLLNPALPDAILAGKKAGLSLALCTNGVLLNRPILEKILPHLSWLRVSAIESTPENYAKSHVCPVKQWEQVVENLKTAVGIRNREKLETVIAAHFIPFPHNVDTVVATTRMAKDLGLDYILIKTANQGIHSPQHNWDKSLFERYRALMDQAAALQTSEFLVSVRFDQASLQAQEGPFAKSYKACYGIEFETMIDSDACVYPCLHFWRDPEYRIGDLRTQTFEEIWRSDHRRKLFDKLYREHDLNLCHFGCKHCHINASLWELANPPMHKDFL